MEAIETGIEGLVLLRPRRFNDDRGWFMESFNHLRYEELIDSEQFCQDNLSCSKLNVLRGLHFQLAPHAQSKLVSVVRGKVLDVAVDLRKSSPTYSRHYSVILDDVNREQLYIPRGFAHGFVSLAEDTLFSYKCDNYYHQPSEATILWNDPALGIDWGVSEPIVSEKDSEGMLWTEFNSPFD